ncbi:Ig-like domain-containing protein [Methanobrevibacter sp. UBA212]|uniref:Ig-like domain-containing protein n=1 Tax=Methanobrevibacter sp. UBA212 TaxID=1915476 RepID=UPI0025D907F4|nr:Ig-like domain-containing protein [Methanobrevibacter sp. UBA212]
MINERKLLVLLLFSIILISSVSAISAADSNVTDVQTADSEEIEVEQSDSNQDEIQESDSSDEKISAGNPKSFSELNRTINNNTDSLIVLDDDYSYNGDTDSAFLMGITINRAVTIDGNGHTIDGCSNSAKGFRAYNYDILFKNIKFVNLGKTTNYDYYGGAIYGSSYNGIVKAQNCEFIGCQGYQGGALYYVSADNCTFKDCKCAYVYQRGGAAMYSGIATNCLFENNGESSSNGVMDGGTAINCTFKNNRGSDSGALYGGTAINCTFIGNRAYSGGAIGGYDWKAFNCTFINNTATYGGAVYANQFSSGTRRGYAVDCHFENNTASYGGAAYRPVIVVCTFKGNSASNGADCYNVQFPTVSMATTTVYGNYPSASLPLDLYYYNSYVPSNYYPGSYYHFKGAQLNLVVNNNSQYVGTYQGISGSSYDFDLEPGTYTVRVSFTNSANSNSISPNTYTLVIKGYKTAINATDLEIEYNNTSNLTVTLVADYDGTSLANKTLTVIFNGNSSYAKTNEKGQITIDIPKLPAETYPVDISFGGDDVYEPFFKTVYVTVDKIATQLSSANVTAFFNEGKVVARLTDKDGKPLADSNVSLHLAYIHRTFKTNQSGEVEFEIQGLAEGNHTGQIVFENDPVYADSNISINVYLYRLVSNLTADNLTFVFGESGILTAYLKDSDGKPIGNATIDLVIDRIYETLKTNSDGQVGFDLSNKLSVGTFNGYLYFDMTNRYADSSIPVNVTVNKISTSISAPDVTCTYGEDKYVVVTLKDKYGNPLANGTVSVKLAFKTLTGKTDADGQAKFKIDLAPKEYVAAISFVGNGTHLSSSSSLNIVVNQINNKVSTEITGYNLTSVYNEGKYMTVTLKDDYGNLMGNRPLTINFNGKTRTYMTDGSGQVKLSTASLIPNTYVANVNFAGDSKYGNSSFSINLVVKKANPYLFASKKKLKVKSAKKFKVTLKTNRNAAMKKVKIYLKVKGKTYAAKTNSKGQAIFKLKKLTKKGTYNAVVTYKGNNCYNKVTKNVKITIK